MTNEQVVKSTWAQVSQADFSNLLMRTGLLKQMPITSAPSKQLWGTILPDVEVKVHLVIFELVGKEVFGTYKGTRVFVYRTGG